MRNNPKVINMELIIMDEQGAKIHATVSSKLVPMFKQQLTEGDAVVLRMYSLGQTQPAYRVVPNPIKLNFVSKTQVSQCVDFKGPVHGFVFKPFEDIFQCQTEAMGQFDVIGQVIEFPELDNYGGNRSERSAYQFLATRERNGKLDEFSSDFNRIINRKYAFKINMDDWQSKKELPSWTIQKMSDDPEIINAPIPMITPQKDQTSDAAVKDTNVPQLDLASVMDDNGTPFKLLKSITSTPNNSGSTDKLNGDGVLEDEGSNTKRHLIEEMGEKN
nr:hypothetical protein [Tanacetum cinerariifolium]